MTLRSHGDTPEFYASVLAACRDTVRANYPPTTVIRRTFADTHIPPGQQWAMAIRRRQTELLARGDIVWAYLVQDRRDPQIGGAVSAPGEVVYCTDEHARADPSTLQFVAAAILRMIERAPHSAAAEALLAKHLNPEISRAYGLLVPETCWADYCAEVSSVLIVPSDFPGEALTFPYFPAAVLADGTAMPVPSRYWPPDFRILWKSQP